MNNTGTKYVRIMKQTSFLIEKKRRVSNMFKFFLNFSTSCKQDVNNTVKKYVRIMKQTEFLIEKKRRVYTMFKIFSTYIC